MYRVLFVTVLVALGNAQPTSKSGNTKIIGGEETTIEKLPYQASLRHFTIPICGCTIIDPYTVITAAHCTFDKNPDYLYVQAGSTDNREGGQVVNVDHYIPHEKYARLIQDYDISILKLKTPLVFGPGVAAAELQEAGEELPVGTEALISGWGRTVEGDSHSSSQTLRKVDVNVISIEECQKKYKNHPLTDRMMCCTSNGKDSCQGDSGGPLFSNNKLVGVVSWGQGCANPKYAGVYTKISALRPWIDEHRQ